MVKGIVNAFEDMEFGFVISLTMGGIWAVIWPPVIATRYVSFCYYFKYQIASTCYPLISNTAVTVIMAKQSLIRLLREF